MQDGGNRNLRQVDDAALFKDLMEDNENVPVVRILSFSANEVNFYFFMLFAH